MTKTQVETHARSWHGRMVTAATALSGHVGGVALGLDVSKSSIESAREKLYEIVEELDEEIEWALQRARE